jgi:hypothetical protein
MRKRRKAAQISEVPISLCEEPDNTEKKPVGGDYYVSEPTHELQGDDIWVTTSDRTTNRLP